MPGEVAVDGRVARLTNSASAFGLEFDSLADVISFGLAPAVLAFAWGLSELGRGGWAAGFVYVTDTSAAHGKLTTISIPQRGQRSSAVFSRGLRGNCLAGDARGAESLGHELDVLDAHAEPQGAHPARVFHLVLDRLKDEAHAVVIACVDVG